MARILVGPWAARRCLIWVLRSITGEAEEQPQKSGVAITDLFTGVYAVTAILDALHQR